MKQEVKEEEAKVPQAKTQAKDLNKYYTKDTVVSQCLNLAKQYIKPSKNDLIIEPSAGNGAFIEGIKELSNHYLFYDLNPEHPEIIKQDYLDAIVAPALNPLKKIHVIGNPPFGRQSSLAIKFIKKSCEFCDSLSFILPKSFKKESLKKTFPLHFHLIFEIDLPKNSFLVAGEEYDVPCIFQIWKKSDEERDAPEKLVPIHFIFTGQLDDPDISFRRVGINAGKIDAANIDEKSVQSHYFIKFTNGKSIEDNLEVLKGITFNHDNTVGPRSISKQELIKEFIKVL